MLVLVLTQNLIYSRIGDIIEVQLPPPALTHHQQTHPTGNGALLFVFIRVPQQNPNLNDKSAEPKHRGFAFVTFGSSADAQDAIDNMDMNELKGRVLKVNLARPMKGTLQPNGNRASKLLFALNFIFFALYSNGLNASVYFLSLGIRGMVKRACKTSGTIWRSVYFHFYLYLWFQL